MKKLLPLFFLLFSLQAFAQNHYLGIKGGSSVTDALSEDFFDETDYRFGYTGGVTYDYYINKNISIGAELFYIQRGFRHTVENEDGTFTRLSGQTIDFNYEYAALPIKASYTLGSKLFGVFSLGIVPSYLLKASHSFPPQVVEGSDENFIVENTGDATSYDLAGLGELSGGYRFNNGTSIYLAGSYQYSLMEISNSDYFADSKIWHHGISVMLGVKFQLVPSPEDTAD